MPRVLLKENIDVEMANLLDMPPREVAALTSIFLDLLRRGLVQNGAVQLARLGTLRVVKRMGVHNKATLTTYKNEKHVVDIRAKYYVSFSKSDVLRTELRERFGPGATSSKEKSHGEVRRRPKRRRKSRKESK